VVCTPEKPEKFPGFFPSYSMLSSMGIQALKSLRLTEVLYSYFDDHLWHVTFGFNEGTLSPPVNTYSGQDSDD